jgi:hypothetical protein
VKGIIDVIRYAIQRLARKINGRVFGMSLIVFDGVMLRYRSRELSSGTSIPFPMCYPRRSRCLYVLFFGERHHFDTNSNIDLYLIRPPADASHTPVKPEHITLAGDSAGGGLTLALLQVLRDSGLPLPAGAILVSPWCELTHSFPSIHTNTATVCRDLCWLNCGF